MRLGLAEVDILENLGIAILIQEKVAEATALFRKRVSMSPASPTSQYLLGFALTKSGEFREAVEHFRKALEMNPSNVEVANALAWVLATCPRAEIRDGSEAVRLAEGVCDATGYRHPALPSFAFSRLLRLTTAG